MPILSQKVQRHLRVSDFFIRISNELVFFLLKISRNNAVLPELGTTLVHQLLAIHSPRKEIFRHSLRSDLLNFCFLVVCSQILYVLSKNHQTSPTVDYTQVGRENFKEIKAFGMSLKHQLFSMPGMPISMATKTAAITEMVKTIESVIAVKVFFEAFFGQTIFLPNPPNGSMGRHGGVRNSKSRVSHMLFRSSGCDLTNQ